MGSRWCVLLLAVALSGCAGTTSDIGAPGSVTASPAPASPSPSPTTFRCEYPDGGYALSSPVAWSVAGGDGIEPCTFFDPEPLALEPGTEATGVAIRADVRDVPLVQARRDQPGVQEERGSGSVRATGTYTDEALLPPGTAFTTWLIALGDRTLLLTTEGPDHVDVLDAMAETVEPL